MSAKTLRRALLWALVIYSVGSLIFTPFEMLKESIIHVLPWVGVGAIVSEALFIGGLCIMAASLGLKIGNPLKLRQELKSILRAATATRMFWIGFWVNALGACATTVLLGAGIVIALPVTSWGLLLLLLVDLAATVTIRRWAIKANAHERDHSL